jgi:hypothetical protein
MLAKIQKKLSVIKNIPYVCKQKITGTGFLKGYGGKPPAAGRRNG